MLEADGHVVNCVQPHPFYPSTCPFLTQLTLLTFSINLVCCVYFFVVLATSGIDYDVKLWAPTAEESTFDEERAEQVRTSV